MQVQMVTARLTMMLLVIAIVLAVTLFVLVERVGNSTAEIKTLVQHENVLIGEIDSTYDLTERSIVVSRGIEQQTLAIAKILQSR